MILRANALFIVAVMGLTACSKKAEENKETVAEETGSEFAIDKSKIPECKDINIADEPPTPSGTAAPTTSPNPGQNTAQNLLPILKKGPNQSKGPGQNMIGNTSPSPAADSPVEPIMHPIAQRICVDENGNLRIERRHHKGKFQKVAMIVLLLPKNGKWLVSEMLKNVDALKNKSVELTPELITKAVATATQLMTLLDADSDGKVTKSEFVSTQLITSESSIVEVVKTYFTDLFDKVAIGGEGEEKYINLDLLKKLTESILI